MMFKKYVVKLSNTIGAVEYLKTKKSNKYEPNNNELSYLRRHSSIDQEHLEDLLEIGAVISQKARASSFDTSMLAIPAAEIIISTAIEELRDKFLFYPLVFICFQSLKYKINEIILVISFGESCALRSQAFLTKTYKQ